MSELVHPRIDKKLNRSNAAPDVVLEAGACARPAGRALFVIVHFTVNDRSTVFFVLSMKFKIVSEMRPQSPFPVMALSDIKLWTIEKPSMYFV